MQAKKTTAKKPVKKSTAKKGTTTKSTAKNTSTKAKSAPPQKGSAHPHGTRQFNAIILFACALILFFVALIEGKFIWLYLHNFLFGLFGICLFFWPVLLTYLAIVNTLDKPIASTSGKIVQSSALIAIIGAIINVATSNITTYSDHLKNGYLSGVELEGGGFFGALVGFPMGKLLGEIGALIVLTILSFVLVMLIFGLTLGSVWKGLTAPIRHIEKTASAYYQDRHERKLTDEPRTDKQHEDPPYEEKINKKAQKAEYKQRRKEQQEEPPYISGNMNDDYVDHRRVIASNKFDSIDVPLGEPFDTANAEGQVNIEMPKSTGEVVKNSYYESLAQPVDPNKSVETVVYSSIDDIISKSSQKTMTDELSRSKNISDKNIIFSPFKIAPNTDQRAAYDISGLNSEDTADEAERLVDLDQEKITHPVPNVEPIDMAVEPIFESAETKSASVSGGYEAIGTAESILKQYEMDIEPKSVAMKPGNISNISTIKEYNKPSDVTHENIEEENLKQPAGTENSTEEKAEPAGLDILNISPVVPYAYRYPPATLLKSIKNDKNEDIRDELKNNAERLVNTLKSFGVETRIIDISRGPAVTRYELQPSAGVKISKITSLADDIALGLASAGVRIEAPIPNKSAVGIEVPNKVISIVGIKEIIESKNFTSLKSKLAIALGKDITGTATVADMAKFPHVLIAGATGSGKSICINSIIISLLYKASPDEVKLLMIDPKVVELGIYNGIPHLLVPVVTDPRKAAGALGWAVTEMLRRYKLFADSNVRDLAAYNKHAEKNELEKVPQIVIIIDELADLMMAAPNEVEDSICRLAQMARAAGMHLVIATQRPSVDVITGIIKANIPSRIAFAVSSSVDSRTILDSGGAEKLMGRGDMLFYPVGTSKPVRVQGCYVSDSEVEAVVSHVKEKAEVVYDNFVMEEIEKQAVPEKQSKGATGSGSNDSDDEMINDAIQVVIEAGSASTSLLQRRLRVGYARAARIIDQMEERGIVGAYEGSKPRQVLLSKAQWQEMQTRMD